MSEDLFTDDDMTNAEDRMRQADAAPTTEDRPTPDDDMLEAAWNLIANASSGNWSKQSQEWQEAAKRWRSSYFERGGRASLRKPVTPEPNESIETRDARRYWRLRVLGAAPYGYDGLNEALVLTFTNLDAFVDKDIATHPSRGEAELQPLRKPVTP